MLARTVRLAARRRRPPASAVCRQTPWLPLPAFRQQQQVRGFLESPTTPPSSTSNASSTTTKPRKAADKEEDGSGATLDASTSTSSTATPSFINVNPEQSNPSTATATTTPRSPNPAHRKLMQREEKRLKDEQRAAAKAKKGKVSDGTAAYADATSEETEAAPRKLDKGKGRAEDSRTIAVNSGTDHPLSGRAPSSSSTTSSTSSAEGKVHTAEAAGTSSNSTHDTRRENADHRPVFVEGEWLKNGQDRNVQEASREPKNTSTFRRASPNTGDRPDESMLIQLPNNTTMHASSPRAPEPGIDEGDASSTASTSTRPNGTTPSSASSSPSDSQPPTSSEAGFLPSLPSHSISLPLTRHPFNTNRFVAALERTGEFKRETAVELMRATKALIIRAEDRAARELVPKADLENEAYLFNAALSELKTEIQMKARTDSIALRSSNNQLQREVDSLAQKMREDMNSLKNDNQLDFNNRKEEASADISSLEQKILDMNQAFALRVGDTRALLESNKWVQTRRSIIMIAMLAIVIMAWIATAPAPAPPPPPQPPSAEQLGLKTIEEPESNDTGFFAGWLSNNADKTKKDGHSSAPPPPGALPQAKTIASSQTGIQERHV